MLRDLLAVNCAKFISTLVKSLKLGSGSALPGRIALKISPNILQNFKSQIGFENKIDFAVTGTNGKTTSTGILKQICIEATHEPVICNDMGANLYYGIVSELVNSSNALTKLKSHNLVLELDEASLPAVAKILKPKTILATNVFRDQLDRFGELDSTLKLIVKGIEAALDPQHKTTVVYNLDDEKLAKLPEFIGDKANFYSFKVESETKIKNLDSALLNSSGKADFFANIIEDDLNSSLIEIGDKKARIQLRLMLPGLYNVYNATAAAAAAYNQGISLETIKTGIENYKTNFGRSEKKIYKNKNLQIFLIKNPTGCTEVLKHIAKDENASFVIALNDNYADGRDVSWIWDVEFDLLANQKNPVYCTGHRSRDISLRLKYAGVKNIVTGDNLIATIEKAVSEAKGDVYILPTYTALLEISKKI